MEVYKERKEHLEKEEEDEKGKKSTKGKTLFDPMAKAVLREAIITKSHCEEDEEKIGVKDAEVVLPVCSCLPPCLPLIGFLGIAFKFAEIEFSAKVDNLMEASMYVSTLDAMIDREIGLNCAKSSNSNSRNLVRVKRSIDMLKVIFEQILAKRGNSIMGPVSTAYQQVFAPYHGWAIRTAVSASLPTLPRKARLMKKLNENGKSM
ncbi:accelerated cell death 11-like [Vitis riparia]|uniref:accelerated cell death 11-like n=1 Tax=Vitis riparia TaxID=96939 RepID=UPI00155A47B4|nr:accelerated cell death 11-like [Vitis riparia]